MSKSYVTTTVETKTTTAVVVDEPRIPIEKWGSDHWSTFAYIETRCVDHKGVPDVRHMRCDQKLHPQFSHAGCDNGKTYPTRYKGGELADHDDWSCMDDCELLGLIENRGTGLHRVYKLTALGKLVAGQLRSHKMNDGNWATFTPTI